MEWTGLAHKTGKAASLSGTHYVTCN